MMLDVTIYFNGKNSMHIQQKKVIPILNHTRVSKWAKNDKSAINYSFKSNKKT